MFDARKPASQAGFRALTDFSELNRRKLFFIYASKMLIPLMFAIKILFGGWD